MSRCRFSTWRRSGGVRPPVTVSRAASRWPSGPRSWGTCGSGTPSTTTWRHRLLGHQRADLAHRRADPDDPARRGRGDAAQPRAAGHRRAVRHPGRHVSGPDRPRPGPGAGLGSEHHVRAAPRPELSRHLPAGRAGAAGLSQRQYPGPGVDASPARARTSRSTSWARRCSGPSWPPRSACPTRSPRTSRRPSSNRPWPSTGIFPAVGQLERPYAIAGVNVIAADTDSDAQEQLPGHPAQAGHQPVPARAPGMGDGAPDRRAGRPAAGRRPRRPRGSDAHLLRGRHPGQVSDYLDGFIRHTEADELIVAHQAPAIEQRLRSVTLLAEAMRPSPPDPHGRYRVMRGDRPAGAARGLAANRPLADRRAGRSGTVRGQLTLRREGDEISGPSRAPYLERIPAGRIPLLLPGRAEDGWWLYFPDGRPFHAWAAGSVGAPPCREDSYRGLITITGPDQWGTQWEVDGPAKAQRIIAWLSRSAALYLDQSRFRASRRASASWPRRANAGRSSGATKRDAPLKVNSAA